MRCALYTSFISATPSEQTSSAPANSNLSRKPRKSSTFRGSTYKGIRNMSDINLFRNNFYLPPMFGGDATPKVPFVIEDTFDDQNTRSLLYGKQLTTYHKNVILSVINELVSGKASHCTYRDALLLLSLVQSRTTSIHPHSKSGIYLRCQHTCHPQLLRR